MRASAEEHGLLVYERDFFLPFSRPSRYKSIFRFTDLPLSKSWPLNSGGMISVASNFGF